MKTNKTLQKEKKEDDLSKLKSKRDDLLIQIEETTDYEKSMTLQKKHNNLCLQIEAETNFIAPKCSKKNYTYNPIKVIKNSPTKRCG